MIVRDSNGRKVEISIYGDSYDDVQVDDAVYLDNGAPVDESEIDFIMQEYGGEMSEQWVENQMGKAEDYYEGDR